MFLKNNLKNCYFYIKTNDFTCTLAIWGIKLPEKILRHVTCILIVHILIKFGIKNDCFILDGGKVGHFLCKITS